MGAGHLLPNSEVKDRGGLADPRDPSSPHKSRLHDVLDQMVQAGVLEKHGATYIPGTNYGKYLDAAAPVQQSSG